MAISLSNGHLGIRLPLLLTMADPGTCIECIGPEELAQDVAVPAPSAPETKVQDPLDVATFVPPSPLPLPNIIIEFCDKV